MTKAAVNTDATEFEIKIPDVTNLDPKVALNTKVV